MKKKFSLVLATAIGLTAIAPVTVYANGHANLPSDLPSNNARPGQCFARVLVPATFRNVPVDYVSQEAIEQVEVSQPTFRLRPETVVTHDGYTRYVVTQPTFRTETATIVTRPAHERLVAVPAQVRTVNETITIREPRMVWRQGSNLSGVRRLDSNTGEIYCLVEERGVTQTVVRRVQASPAGVQRVAVPAQTQTLTRQVLATRGGVQEIEVPAQTQTIQVQELASRAEERRVTIPEQRASVNRQVLETPERYEWVQVECDNSGAQATQVPMNSRATTSTVRGVPVPMNSRPQSVTISTRELQRALAVKGFYRGPIDGIYGTLTRNAVAAFQRQNGMTATGQVNADVVRALNLAN